MVKQNMNFKQIARINRPLEKDNRLLAGYFIEKWLREGNTKVLFVSFYEEGRDIPFVVFTVERASNKPEILVLLNEDREILGAFINGKDSGETIFEEIIRNLSRPEDAFTLEIEEGVEEE
ncbi:MAG: hypothetical protein JHC26_10815 [Thermofilum sp.]|jgi:hypothetical protein|uniref:hypothetical protein n=1 Tax=Thermofilum sp. TaxID=1961369 RepID=UPI00258B762F|nr:hypothetical protein [Thermofilum sp.]MCI4409573.1 hypothetical protein [Thermofilum sp.]